MFPRVTNYPLFYSDEEVMEVPWPVNNEEIVEISSSSPEVVEVHPPSPQQRRKRGSQHPAWE